MEKHIYHIGGVTVTTTFTSDLDEDFPEWLASTGVRGGVVGFAVQRLYQDWRNAILYGEPDRRPIVLILMAIGSHCLVAKISIYRVSNKGCIHTRNSGFRRFLKNPGFTFCGISVETNLAEVSYSFDTIGRSVCLDLGVAATERPACANLVQSLVNVEADWSDTGEHWNSFTDAQMKHLTMEAFFSAAIGDVLMA